MKTLDDEFHSVLAEIDFYTPRNLEEVRDEALKLQFSLKQCQENENRLSLKCKFLKFLFSLLIKKFKLIIIFYCKQLMLLKI